MIDTHTVPRCTEPTLVILQTELADPQAPIWDIRILLGEGCIIPGLNVVFPETDGAYPKAYRVHCSG